ncbi:MAG TPA: alkaline phosphatase, partial [Candidatus Sumerlaeota bacterium]|nr:alkaline phosphatase [Candidatus Sumerlaeota bacterium]
MSLLDDDPDGFFLMVEGAKIDKACHANNLERAVCET